MEQLEDFISGPEESDTLDDIASPEVSPSKSLPKSAVRNRAAVLAAVSNAEDGGLEVYQQIMAENELGITSTADAVRKMAAQRTRDLEYESGVIPILSDEAVDLATKQAVIDAFRDQQDQDSILTLASDSLIADSPDETVDASEARISLSDDLFVNFQESYSKEQALINNFRRELDKQATTLGQAVDIAQQVLIPVGTGISAYSFINEINEKLKEHDKIGSKLGAVLRPGAAFEEVRARYEGLDSNERLIFLGTIIDAIKDSQGVIFSSDSQFQALHNLEKIVGDYSPGEAAFDTVANLLDIIGVGLIAKAGIRGLRAKKAGDPIPVEKDIVEGKTPPEYKAPEDLTIPKPSPEKEKLPALYAKKEELIADSSKVLPNRSVATLEKEAVQVEEALRGIDSAFKQEVKRLQVRQKLSRKQAESEANKMLGEQRTDLEARRNRIENLLEQNRQGQRSQDKIKAIETEIERIENIPDADGIVRVNPIVDALNRAERNSLIALENPASVGSVLMRTNPDRARKLVFASFADEGGETARAIFGMPKNEAIASVFVPKQVTNTGVIGARPVDVMEGVNKGVETFLDELKAVIESKGSVALTAGEQERAANAIINDFRNPTGLKVFDGMDGFHADMKDGKITLSSVYGSAGGPFSSAEDAINSVKISLKEYGDMASRAELLKKDGINYVPTTLEAEKGKKGDYLVRLNYSHQVDYKDVDLKKLGPLDRFKVKWNMADSIPALIGDKQGSATRHVLHTAAIFDKHLATAASVGDVLTNRMEKVLQAKIRDIAEGLKGLTKKEQDALSAYWVEANEKGIPLTLSDFADRGFTQAQYQLATEWREYWDAVFYLQNKDLKHTLRGQGYQILDNGQDRLFAKPVSKDIRFAQEVYDPESGKIINLSRQEMDDLYEKGGTLATTKTKLKVDGKETNNLLVKNTPESYLRAFDEADQVLNYRQGYFTTSYKAPIFIDKVDPKTGDRIAVATAKDRAEAQQFVDRSLIENPEAQFIIRPDKKRLADHKEDVWSLNEQAGTSAQRRRGKPLIEADGSNRLEGGAYFDKPFESAIRASRSIAGRTIMRDIIQTAKERAMQKHGHLFPTENGVPKYPSKISDISSPAGPFTKEVRDARTDFEYINYLENGYVNSLDNMFKTMAGVLANGLGEASVKTTGVTKKTLAAAERGAHKLGEIGPSQAGKFAVFQAYIATSFLRQWLVQPAQAVRLFNYNPTGFPNISRYLAEYTTSLVGNTHLTENGKKFIKFLDDTGFLDSVDKSNLVRGTLTTASEQSSFYEKTLGRITNPLRTLGYDLGEKTNIATTAAAVFDKYLKEGKDITSKAVQHEMIGKIDAISYSMRFSGDMPYNQNSLALFAQFFQVPHKASLQMFDRRLTPAERTRLVVGDILLYGGATTPIIMAADALFGEEALDSNPFLKELVVDGALSAIINTSLNNIMDYVDLPQGELDVAGSLSPFEFAGYKKMVMSLLQDGGLMAAIGETPIGGMILKDGNRVQKAIMSATRFAGFVPDSEIAPTDVSEVLNDVASITAGWNNIQKAKLAWELNKIMTKEGQVLVNGLSPIQIIGQAFGMQPKEISEYYESSIELSKNKKEYEKDVRSATKTAIQVAVGKTKVGVEDQRTRDIVTSLLMHEYRGKPEAWRFINDEMGRAAQDPTVGLLNSAYKAMAFPEYDQDRETLKKVLSPEYVKKIEQWQADLDAAINK